MRDDEEDAGKIYEGVILTPKAPETGSVAWIPVPVVNVFTPVYPVSLYKYCWTPTGVIVESALFENAVVCECCGTLTNIGVSLSDLFK